jgi:hypothetical protein
LVLDLPISQLEVCTAAFATLAMFTYAANWAKPKDIGIPILGGNSTCQESSHRFYGESFVQRFFRPSKNRLYNFTSWDYRISNDAVRPQSQQTPFITLSNALAFSTACFGGIHCAAWGSEFPSRTEQLLWLITSVLSATMPVSNLVMVAATNTALLWKQRKIFRQIEQEREKTYFYVDIKESSQTVLIWKDNMLWANRTVHMKASVALRRILALED